MGNGLLTVHSAESQSFHSDDHQPLRIHQCILFNEVNQYIMLRFMGRASSVLKSEDVKHRRKNVKNF